MYKKPNNRSRALALASPALLFAGFVHGHIAHAATVESFSPQGTVKAVRQVVVRFSEPMVAFGDPRLPEPFDIDCTAQGRARWADARNWVYDFGADLPAGLSCRYTVKPGLRSLAGAAITGRRKFRFDTGGPSIRASLPYDGDQGIDSEQAFVLALDAAATPASVTEHAACAIENLAERVPVRVLDGRERERVLAQRRALGYRYRQLLREPPAPVGRAAGGAEAAAAARDALARAESELIVLKCRRSLPPDSAVSLIWGRGIRTASGLATRAQQSLFFRTRPEFTVRIQCDRVNPNAPCLPIRPVRVTFTAPVPVEHARAISVTDGSGRIYRATELASKAQPALETLTFAGPFPERGELTVALGAGLVDDAGRKPANAARFPLEVPLDDYPPLVKFSGNFGILERAAGGVLPVTVRNVEPSLAGRQFALARADGMTGRALRVDQDVDVARWLERVRKATAARGEWQQTDETTNGERASRWKELTGADSVFAEDEATTAFKLPLTGGERSFEVIGIPLREPGFHVVELASPRLGQALLGVDRPRHVATAALVTNLAVHFKWGRESSRVWVTALDSGKPVRAAQLRISGYCTGRDFWAGETNGDGIGRIETGLGEPHGDGECNRWSREPLMVSARAGDDFSFALSSWQQGISPGDFNVPVGWAGERGSYLARSVFDRTLLRAGETVSMKHFFRQRVSTGLRIPARARFPTQGVVTHYGSGQQYTFALEFDAAGIAESKWAIPRDAKLGEYGITLRRTGRDREASEPGANDSSATGGEGGEDGDASFDAGDIRVEQYRVPTMKAVVQPPRAPLINAKRATLDLYVGYLSGGGAARARVALRTLIEPRWLTFRDFADFSFGGEDVVEGISDPNDGDDEAWWYATLSGGERPDGAGPGPAAAQVQPLTLDEQGAARATVPLPAITSAQSLVAELEYEDASGERLTTATRVPLWPSGISLGLRMDGWAATRDELRLKVAAVDPAGKPVAHRKVDVDLFKRETYSYRKRLVGGFYAYENKVETTRLPVSCSGRTTRQGLLDCRLAPGVSGEVVLRARAADDSGNAAIATTTAWVVGEDDWWFAPGNADRMDVLPERKEYQPGETARFQVRVPFRASTALVTVEREGVIESFVTRLRGREPVIEVPIEGRYAPNVYVSVLAVRGRVAGWRAWLADLARRIHLPWEFEGGAATAVIDLSKPAFKSGLAQIRVGWSAHRLEVEVEPSSETYRVRDKASVDVRVRREDGKPLPPGAELAFAAVDEGLLELRSNESWALLDRMMDARPIEVWTSTAQMQVVGKRHFGRKALPAGGGGGRAGARELFDTLLLWRGRVRLDGAGHARIAVPLNDSLTSFRLVAVASAGGQFFGTGQATIRTTQELMLHSGLPPLVRDGDRYAATFTARNASKRAMTIVATAKFTTEQNGSAKIGSGPAPAAEPTSVKSGSELKSGLPARTVEIPPGRATELVWTVDVPVGASSLVWDVRAVEKGGNAQDQLRARQTVAAAVPLRTYQATLGQLDGTLALTASRPAGALPGRGGVRVALSPSLVAGLTGVRDYMSRYPYTCLEQRISVAVALRDPVRWEAEMARLPAHLDRDGLLRYFPSDAVDGSDTLTAYVLAIADEAGYAIPADVRARLLEALTGFVGGRVLRDSVLPTADLTLRKLAAIESLARHGAADASMLSSFSIEPNLWPTSAVIDWTSLLARIDGVPRRAARRAEAEQILRSRLNFQGTTMGFSTEPNDALPWLMVSADVNAVRAILALRHAAGWREDIPRMLRGALDRQHRGHWDTTTANAWGVLATQKFAAAYETTPIDGRTTIRFGAAERAVGWKPGATPAAIVFPWSNGAATLTAVHAGSGRPWTLIESRAALPLTAPVSTGYAIERRLTPVEQRVKGAWTRGDVARVTLTVDAQSDMGWVVLDDPIPTGSTILGGGLGRDSTLLARDETREGWVYPAYEERRFDGFRAYYGYVPKGRFTVEYTVRLNTPGTFRLPATRVEAIYAPEMFGESPNAPIEVRRR